MATNLEEQKENSSSSTINEEREQPNNQPDLEKQVTQATSIIPVPKFPETDLSQGLVGWDGQDDPENPQNFAAGKKWALLALISAFTLISPLASSMFSPAVVYMAEEFHETNETILSFTVSIYLVGYVVSGK